MRASIRHNFLMNAILTASSFIFPLISFPYIQRVLGPEGTGKVSFASSVVSYFWLIAYLGIPTYGVRATAQVRDDRIKLSRLVQELFALSLIMTAVAYFVFFLSLMVVPRFQEDKWLYVVISLEFFFYTIGIEWMFRGLEQYTYISLTSVAFKILAIAGMFCFVRTKDDYLLYGGLTIFASSASYCLNFLYSRRFISLHRTERLNISRHIRPVLLFAAMSCATMIYLHLDVAMLGFMKSNVDVGYYNAAVKIKVILVSFVTSLGHVLLPRLSYYLEKDQRDEFFRLVQKGLEFVFLTASPLVFFFIIYARPVVFLLSGVAYAPSILPMQIIMPTVLFIGLSNLFGIQVLVPQGKEKLVLYSVIAGAVTDLILNAFLIPGHGAAGAAFGTVIAELIVLLIQYWYLHDELSKIVHGLPYGKILFSLCLSIGASFLSQPIITLIPIDRSLSWIYYFLVLLVAALLFFSVYFGMLLLLREPFVVSVWRGLFQSRRNSQ